MSEAATLEATLARQLRSAPQAAAATLRALGDQGDAQANFLLAQMLVEGRGLPCDAVQAQERYFLAANAGHRLAMNMLGRCHELGVGTAINPELAAVWYQRAARRGLDWGMYNFANLLASGRGVNADPQAALAWYQRAAALGHAKSMNLVGRYLEQAGTEQARAQAAHWYLRSALAGDFRGQASHASVLLERGQVQAAIGWYLRAIGHGSASFLAHLGQQLGSLPATVAAALAPALRARQDQLEPGPPLPGRGPPAIDSNSHS
jgi:TPR repeat protein